jgi:hypothetical protein
MQNTTSELFQPIDLTNLDAITGGWSWSRFADGFVEGGGLGLIGGAEIGSLWPGVGTAIGGAVGGIGGALIGGVMKGYFSDPPTSCSPATLPQSAPQSQPSLQYI